MKRSLKIIITLLVLSFGLNIYYIIDYFEFVKRKKELEQIMNFNKEIKNISYKTGTDFLLHKIEQTNPIAFKKKKYYFISVWNVICVPCIKEMPLLDTLTENINNDNVGYIYATENGDKMITEFIKKRKLSLKYFTFINYADPFISALLKEKKLKNRQYPIQLIIDKFGKILYFKIGTIESANDSEILKLTKTLQ